MGFDSITEYEHSSGLPVYDSIFKPRLKQVYTYRNSVALLDGDSQLISRLIYRKGQKEVFQFQFYGPDGKELYELYDTGSRVSIDAVHPVSENKFKKYHFGHYGSHGLTDTAIITTWDNGNMKSVMKNSIGDRGLGPAEKRFDSLGRETYHYEANWFYRTSYTELGSNEVMVINQPARNGMGAVPADTSIWITDDSGHLLQEKYPQNHLEREFYATGMIKTEQRKIHHSKDTLERYRYEYEGSFNKRMITYLEFPIGNNLRKMKPRELDIVRNKLDKKYLGYEILPEHSFIEITEDKDTICFLTAESAESIDFLWILGHKVGAFSGHLPHHQLYPKDAQVLAVGFKDISGDEQKDIVILTKTTYKESSSYEALVYLFQPKHHGSYSFSPSYTDKLRGAQNFEEVTQRLGD